MTDRITHAMLRLRVDALVHCASSYRPRSKFARMARRVFESLIDGERIDDAYGYEILATCVPERRSRPVVEAARMRWTSRR